MGCVETQSAASLHKCRECLRVLGVPCARYRELPTSLGLNQRQLIGDAAGHVAARFAVFEDAPPRDGVGRWCPVKLDRGRRQPLPIDHRFGGAGGIDPVERGNSLADVVQGTGLPRRNGLDCLGDVKWRRNVHRLRPHFGGFGAI